MYVLDVQVSASVCAGMTMEGLFRVPGPAAVLEELRDAFEEGDPIRNIIQPAINVWYP